MVHYIGIDDAGRGPVIGPMILAGVLINSEEENKLVEIGVKDSKLLSPSKRNMIGDILKNKFQFAIQEASPEEIDSSTNLNNLEAQKMAMVINELAQKVSGKIEVFVDCPSINELGWKSYLEIFIVDRERIEIKAEHKADAIYPVVSAASIIAKEKREEEVRNLKKEIGKDFGSGYPADPKTKEFLEKNLGDPIVDKIIRHSWSTVKKLKGKSEQGKLF
jgi:ribonuclease HII